jgi:GABA permease
MSPPATPDTSTSARGAPGVAGEIVAMTAAPHTLRRALRLRHMQMIALGGVIGAGLFVGSGVVVSSAGPAAVLSFALTGVLVVLVMRMLGEMAVACPAVGGFYEYSRLALGELAGFLTGWMYWYFWVIVVALEAVAGAKLLAHWWPHASPWQLTLALLGVFTVVNLLSVRSYGEAEFWFASIKVVAIALFLGAGALFVAGLWPGAAGSLRHLTVDGGFMPNGIVPVLTGAVAATGFYFGTEIVTLAAAESAEPERAVAQAMQSVVWRVLTFYVGSIFLVVAILPWNDTVRMERPYVSVLETLRVPAAATAMSIVILTAVLSALNSGLFASSRMLMALARRGDAPRLFATLDARGVPAAAILAGTAFGYAAVVMSYVSPDQVFAFLVSSYGTVAIFVYVLIAISQLKLRRRLEREMPERLRLRMWGFPYLTYCAILAMLAIVIAMAFIPAQRAALVFGCVSVMVLLAVFALRRAALFRAKSPP